MKPVELHVGPAEEDRCWSNISDSAVATPTVNKAVAIMAVEAGLEYSFVTVFLFCVSHLHVMPLLRRKCVASVLLLPDEPQHLDCEGQSVNLLPPDCCGQCRVSVCVYTCVYTCVCMYSPTPVTY